MEAALSLLLPRLIKDRATWRIIPYRGKHRLLRELPSRLRAYARRLQSERHLRIVVLVDSDGQPCTELKERLKRAAEQAGLVTKSRQSAGGFAVLNRIVIQELEAWFLGDIDALKRAFPKVPSVLGKRRGYRDPDAIRNSWERLHQVLRRAGELGDVFPKIETARRIAAHMSPAENRSRSFQSFRSGLEVVLSGCGDGPA